MKSLYSSENWQRLIKLQCANTNVQILNVLYLEVEVGDKNWAIVYIFIAFSWIQDKQSDLGGRKIEENLP